MTKRVFLVHGWDGNPQNSWFPWLKKELESRDFSVQAPAMPDSEHPKIEPWVSKLSEVVGTPDEQTYFIGHSIGNQTIMRYLQTLPEGTKVGGFISVAGFFTLPNLETQEEIDIAKPWLETPIGANKIKKMIDNIISIFSDNDPDVPLSDKELFREKLGAKIIVEHGKGHFSDDFGITELPVVLEELLRISA
jgi:predicted alpha/beta hydrolase family esterase